MIDSITWGNPLQKHLPYLEQEGTSFLEKHVPQLIKFSFPKNTSKSTREELNALVDNIEVMKNNPEILKRYKSYDKSLTKTFADVIVEQELGEKGIEIVDRLLDDTLPLLIKLKFFFQRPRPYQLAHAYKLKLFPYATKSSDSPSYPSGHTLQAHLICYVLGNHFPEKFDYFEKLAKDIEYSRLFLGVHYESDNDYSMYIYELITKDKEFKEKYKL
jgi:acid phosphatase (class A)